MSAVGTIRTWGYVLGAGWAQARARAPGYRSCMRSRRPSVWRRLGLLAWLQRQGKHPPSPFPSPLTLSPQVCGLSGSGVSGIVPTNAYPCLPSGPRTSSSARTTTRCTRTSYMRSERLLWPAYATTHVRVARQAEIEATIVAWTRARSAEEIGAHMHKCAIPVGRVVTVRGPAGRCARCGAGRVGAAGQRGRVKMRETFPVLEGRALKPPRSPRAYGGFVLNLASWCKLESAALDDEICSSRRCQRFPWVTAASEGVMSWYNARRILSMEWLGTAQQCYQASSASQTLQGPPTSFQVTQCLSFFQEARNHRPMLAALATACSGSKSVAMGLK
ncbi:hypothetical protein GGX14DRAFT_588234 [Mycena pura]|uniref:Uncharacterized protein n=1 Tax=Mycena pura TaxID=153505 RepID=A0AAD6XZA5_9AGAR|nr:hypothetical protein GGX14DRAFT_588234 [Mycena pura]